MSFKRFHKTPSSAQRSTFAQALQQGRKSVLFGSLASFAQQAFVHTLQQEQENTAMQTTTTHTHNADALVAVQAAPVCTLQAQVAAVVVECAPMAELNQDLHIDGQDDICIAMPELGLCLDTDAIPGPRPPGGLT